MQSWIKNSLWSWYYCIYLRFVDYNDDIDCNYFFEVLNNGWIQMNDKYIMSQPDFDPYNLLGRDPYYFN